MTIQERIASNRAMDERIAARIAANARKTAQKKTKAYKASLKKALRDLFNTLPAENKKGLIEVLRKAGAPY